MGQNNIHELIFEQWAAELAKKDRTRKGTRGNFEALFSALKSAEISFDDAKALLPRAIKEHSPNPAVKKNTWIKLRANLKLSENEFYDSWISSIRNTATEVFFEEYPVIIKNDDDDGLPKTHGSMSEKEYKLQRRHADSFPTLNTDALEAEYEKRKSNLNIEDVLGDMYGDK